MKFKKQVKLIVFFLGTAGSPANKLYVTHFKNNSTSSTNGEDSSSRKSVRLEGSADRSKAKKFEVADAVGIQSYLEERFKYVTGVEVA